MDIYKNKNTGFFWTLEEIKEAYEDQPKLSFKGR